MTASGGRLASRWLTVVDNENMLARVEFWEGLAFIHTEFRRRVAAMREAKKLFPQLRHWLKRMGHDHCYVAIDPGDEMLVRFERLFGFRDDPRGVCVFGGARIMAREC